MNGNRITNLTPGVDGTDAVNIDQLEAVDVAANAGWNVTDGTNTNNIGPNGTVTFTGDSNITVTESGVDDDGVITVALNKDIDLTDAGSLKIGNSMLNDGGLTVKDGANETTPLATGTTVTDGTNPTEMTATGTTMTDGINMTTTTATRNTVTDSN